MTAAPDVVLPADEPTTDHPAAAAGLDVVMDTCPVIEARRLRLG